MQKINKEKENITQPITTEHLALEILKQEQAKSKAKNVGIIGFRKIFKLGVDLLERNNYTMN